MQWTDALGITLRNEKKAHTKEVYKKSGFFTEKSLETHKLRKTAITLGAIHCGADFAKLHGGHATWSAHGRYLDQHQLDINNPVPAKLAQVIGLK